MELNQMSFLNPLERLPVNSKTPGGFMFYRLFINASSVPYYLTLEMVSDRFFRELRENLKTILVETYLISVTFPKCYLKFVSYCFIW